MSLPTWTPASLSPELRHYREWVWRLVDAQYHVSLRKRTDSLAEQALLEGVVEGTKPAVPVECRGLDPLLSTPFRYAPYPKGSRFLRAGPTPGVYYAAEGARVAVAETAFYRLLFFAESPGHAVAGEPFRVHGLFGGSLVSPFARPDRTAFRRRCVGLAASGRVRTMPGARRRGA